MVLDGNVNPMPDMEYIAYTFARGLDTRINYVIYSCSAKNIEQPGSCPIDDLPKCVSDLNAIYGGKADSVALLLEVINVILSKEGAGVEICTLAADGDADGLTDLLDTIEEETISTTQKKQITGDPTSQPTDESNVYGIPNYLALMDLTATTIVDAQDEFAAFYNADYLAKSEKDDYVEEGPF